MVYLVLFGALIYINHKELLPEVKTFFKNKPGNIFWKIIAGYGIFYALNLFTNVLVQNAEQTANVANSFFNFFDQNNITSSAENQRAIEEILKGNGLLGSINSSNLSIISPSFTTTLEPLPAIVTVRVLGAVNPV